MIPRHTLHLLDDHTLINIIVQVTDHPEATAEDAELLRIAIDIGAMRLGHDALREAIDQVRLARMPDHPFYGISVCEVNYRIEVDADPRWWPAGTWEHFRREVAGFADEVDTEVVPERFWFNTSDGEIDAVGRLNDVIQAWQVALARREEPLDLDFDKDGSEP